MKKRIGNQGFTLIELLVVIAIIGLLSTIVVASLSTVRKKARDAKRVADVKSLQLAMELYFDSNRQYPYSLAALTGNNCGGGSCVPALPKDPSTNIDYSFSPLNAGCTGYHLGVVLEDITNTALQADPDAVVGTLATACSGTVVGAVFSGLSNAAAGVACGSTAGTAQPGGTETCYDITN